MSLITILQHANSNGKSSLYHNAPFYINRSQVDNWLCWPNTKIIDLDHLVVDWCLMTWHVQDEASITCPMYSTKSVKHFGSNGQSSLHHPNTSSFAILRGAHLASSGQNRANSFWPFGHRVMPYDLACARWSFSNMFKYPSKRLKHFGTNDQPSLHLNTSFAMLRGAHWEGPTWLALSKTRANWFWPFGHRVMTEMLYHRCNLVRWSFSNLSHVHRHCVETPEK